MIKATQSFLHSKADPTPLQMDKRKNSKKSRSIHKVDCHTTPPGPGGGRIGVPRPVIGGSITRWFAFFTLSKDPFDIIPDFLCNLLRNVDYFLSFLFHSIPDCFGIVLGFLSQISEGLLGFFTNLGRCIL